VLLADEINRTPPRTQAALLEPCRSGTSVAGRTRWLPTRSWSSRPRTRTSSWHLPLQVAARPVPVQGHARYGTAAEEQAVLRPRTGRSPDVRATSAAADIARLDAAQRS
jgi:hypothetical protein